MFVTRLGLSDLFSLNRRACGHFACESSFNEDDDDDLRRANRSIDVCKDDQHDKNKKRQVLEKLPADDEEINGQKFFFPLCVCLSVSTFDSRRLSFRANFHCFQLFVVVVTFDSTVGSSLLQQVSLSTSNTGVLVGVSTPLGWPTLLVFVYVLNSLTNGRRGLSVCVCVCVWAQLTGHNSPTCCSPLNASLPI